MQRENGIELLVPTMPPVSVMPTEAVYDWLLTRYPEAIRSEIELPLAKEPATLLLQITLPAWRIVTMYSLIRRAPPVEAVKVTEGRPVVTTCPDVGCEIETTGGSVISK